MFKTKLLTPEVDYKSGRVIMRAEVIEGNYREFYDEHHEGIFSIAIKKWRRKRSKDANAYFHVLVGKIATKIDAGNAEIKNRLIAEYGQQEFDSDGKPVYIIIRNDLPVDQWSEIHVKPTTQTKELNGVLYRVYHVMRGSHTYDTKEMSRLIDGALYEGKEAGLTDAELMTPQEKAMLSNSYGIRFEA